MHTSVYSINKGINKPIEFKGLKAQYIGYLGAGLVALLILFAVLYILGIHMFICLGVIGSLGLLLFGGVYRYSDQYGQYGLLKKAAKGRLPRSIRSRSRRCFIHLTNQANT
jgi:hypothetical protein